MLSCARALIRAQARRCPATIAGRWSVTSTRNYAAVSGSQLDLDALLSSREEVKQDLIKEKTHQTEFSEGAVEPSTSSRDGGSEAVGDEAQKTLSRRQKVRRRHLESKARARAAASHDGQAKALHKVGDDNTSFADRQERGGGDLRLLIKRKAQAKAARSDDGQAKTIHKVDIDNSGLPERQGRGEGFIKQQFKSFGTEGRVAFGIVATSHPIEATIEDLIKDIQPMPSCRVPGHKTPTSLVLLLTPGLARHALDDSLSAAVFHRLQPRPAKPKDRVLFTSAVVDRLPAEVGEPGGSEGMAYLLVRDVREQAPEDKTLYQESAQKPGSLTFRVPRVLHHDQPAPVSDYEFQLPLSQTVFTTGLVSTLIDRTYTFTTKPMKLELLSENKLEKQTLELPTMLARNSPHRVTMPLVPLTPFRRINYVMGNIIRKLSSERIPVLEHLVQGPAERKEASEGAGEDMPASQELESAVSEYFEALTLQPETVSVWAFVIPQNAHFPNLSKLRKLCVDNLLRISEDTGSSAWLPKYKSASNISRGTADGIRLLMPRGARLIKVLSGGGGWGKKAGLLSLDPDVQYSTRELRQDDGWHFDFDGADDNTAAAAEARRDQALGQIVKEGDRIMFLLAPKLENMPTSKIDSEAELFPNRTPRSELSFGTIPSSIDVNAQSLPADTDVAVIQHYPNRFGMLSEGGMAVTVNTEQGISGQSKLDVPFSSFNINNYDRRYYPAISSADQFYKEFAAAIAPTARAKQSEGSLGPNDTSEISVIAADVPSAGKSASGAAVKEKNTSTKVSDMFESFAEYDEDEDAATHSAGKKQEPGPESPTR